MHLYATEILLNHTLRSASGLLSKNRIADLPIFTLGLRKSYTYCNV